jgi:uncharacterized protein (UPF0335 family)
MDCSYRKTFFSHDVYVLPFQKQQQKQQQRQQLSDDDISVISVKSTASGVAQIVINTILDSNPRSGPTITRLRSNFEKRERHIEEEERSVASKVREDRDDGEQEFDTKSLGAVSALSKLEHDEVSIRDAIDAQDGVPSPKPGENGINKDIPFWKPAAWYGTFDKLLEIAEYDYEMRRLCKLAAPFTATALLEGLLEAVNVALIGRFISTSALAAYVTVDMIVGLSSSSLSGFQECLTTLCSQAIGAGNKKLAGQYAQLAVVLFVLFFSPFVVLWMYYMADALRWFGFDEGTVTIGADFARIYVFYELLTKVADTLHALLDTIDKENYSSLVSIAKYVFQTLGVLAVALGNDPTLDKVGLVYIYVSAVVMFLNILFIMWNGWFDPYLGGMIGSFAFTVSAAFVASKYVRFISFHHLTKNRFGVSMHCRTGKRYDS